MPTILYMQLKKRIKVNPNQLIRVEDVSHLTGNGEMERYRSIPIYTPTENDGNYVVFSALDVIQIIRQQEPHVDIRNTGLAHIIIELNLKKRVPHRLVMILIWLLLFTGSGLAIMNFHTDVSMRTVHQRIHYMITGKVSKKPLMLQIPYSIGIGAGMILFFNHIFKRRLHEEPSPMELEMFQYQETIDQYLIEEDKKKMESLQNDVTP